MRRLPFCLLVPISCLSCAPRSASISKHPAPSRSPVLADSVVAMSLDEIAGAPEAEDELEHDMPAEAEAFRYMQRLDENGIIPANALVNVKLEKEAMHAAELADPERDAGLTLGGWTWLGPGNIGGRVRAIIIHPTQPNTIWVGGVAGGIWKSTNGGTSWTPLNDFLPALTVSCMAIDPTNANTLYAGTGEGVFGASTGTAILSARPGAGIFKTTDGGTTWTQLASTAPPAGGNPATHDWGFVNRIAISPNGATILAATNGGIFSSTNAGITWIKRTALRTIDVKYHPTDNTRAVAGLEKRLVQRTADSGVTWAGVSLEPVASTTVRIASAPDGNVANDTLEVVSTTNMVANDVILIQGAAAAQDELMCLVSVLDADTIIVPDLQFAHAAGRTVVEQTYPNERVEVAYAPNDGQYVYAAFAEQFCLKTSRLYRSTDGGVVFAVRDSTKGYLGEQGWYDNTIWVDPSNRDHVVVGGIDLWESTSGGTNLNKISDWTNTPTTPHADHHVFVHHPGYNGVGGNRQVYSGNDGGIYYAADLNLATTGGGWTSRNNGIGITQFYGAAANANGTIVGGTQDNGNIRYTPANGANGWTTMYGGDGGFAASDPANANNYYGEYILGRIVQSTDGGATGNYIHAPRGCVSGNGDLTAPCGIGGGCPGCAAGTNALMDAVNGTCNFIAPFILDPNNATRLLVGCDQLWRSNDASAAQPNWATMKASIGRNISAIAVVNGNADRIMVGHNVLLPTDLNARIYITKNGTNANPTWTQVNTGLPARYCSRIAFDPADSTRVFVTFMGYGAQPPDGNVWRGLINWAPTPPTVAWTRICGPGVPGDAYTLPAVPVSSIVCHPTQPGWAYIGTDIGVFATQNANDVVGGAGTGPRWHVADGDAANGEGPANCPIDQVLFRGNSTLIVASHGRGVFSANAAVPTNIERGNQISISTASAQGNNSSDRPAITWDGRFVAFSSDARNMMDNAPMTAAGVSHIYVRDRQPQGVNPGVTTLQDVTPAGGESDSSSFRPDISKDGRYVVFDSTSSNLTVPGSTPARSHVYLRDRQTGITTRVSVAANGAEGNGISHNSAISADGRYIAYTSEATNLVAADTEGNSDIFLYDRLAAANTRISLATGGGGAGGNGHSGFSGNVDISENGRFVVFDSNATNLVANDTNLLTDIFRYDRISGVTVRVNVDSAGNQAGFNNSSGVSISANGLKVAFNSYSSDLVPGGTVNRRHVYLRNFSPPGTSRISLGFLGGEGNADSGLVEPSISPDGNWVGFDSSANNLVDLGTTAGRRHVYLRDLLNSTTQFVSQDTTAFPGFSEGDADSYYQSLASNALSIAFGSDATNIRGAGNDTNGFRDVYAFDRGCLMINAQPVSQTVCEGAAVLMSVSATGGPGVTYQWRKNGTNMIGFTSPAISFPAVGIGDAGTYDVVLNRGCDDVISLPATLTVHATGSPACNMLTCGSAIGSGDVNLDTFVDGRDIRAFVGIVRFNPTGPPSPAFCAADMNMNGSVTTTDIPLFTTRLLMGP